MTALLWSKKQGIIAIIRNNSFINNVFFLNNIFIKRNNFSFSSKKKNNNIKFFKKSNKNKIKKFNNNLFSKSIKRYNNKWKQKKIKRLQNVNNNFIHKTYTINELWVFYKKNKSRWTHFFCNNNKKRWFYKLNNKKIMTWGFVNYIDLKKFQILALPNFFFKFYGQELDLLFDRKFYIKGKENRDFFHFLYKDYKKFSKKLKKENNKFSKNIFKRGLKLKNQRFFYYNFFLKKIKGGYYSRSKSKSKSFFSRLKIKRKISSNLLKWKTTFRKFIKKKLFLKRNKKYFLKKIFFNYPHLLSYKKYHTFYIRRERYAFLYLKYRDIYLNRFWNSNKFSPFFKNFWENTNYWLFHQTLDKNWEIALKKNTMFLFPIFQKILCKKDKNKKYLLNFKKKEHICKNKSKKTSFMKFENKQKRLSNDEYSRISQKNLQKERYEHYQKFIKEQKKRFPYYKKNRYIFHKFSWYKFFWEKGRFSNFVMKPYPPLNDSVPAAKIFKKSYYKYMFINKNKMRLRSSEHFLRRFYKRFFLNIFTHNYLNNKFMRKKLKKKRYRPFFYIWKWRYKVCFVTKAYTYSFFRSYFIDKFKGFVKYFRNLKFLSKDLFSFKKDHHLKLFLKKPFSLIKWYRAKGDFSDIFFLLLVRKLDYLLVKSNFLPNSWMAKQLILHGYIYVNNKKVISLNYLVKNNSIVHLKDVKWIDYIYTYFYNVFYFGYWKTFLDEQYKNHQILKFFGKKRDKVNLNSKLAQSLIRMYKKLSENYISYIGANSKIFPQSMQNFVDCVQKKSMINLKKNVESKLLFKYDRKLNFFLKNNFSLRLKLLLKYYYIILKKYMISHFNIEKISALRILDILFFWNGNKVKKKFLTLKKEVNIYPKIMSFFIKYNNNNEYKIVHKKNFLKYFLCFYYLYSKQFLIKIKKSEILHFLWFAKKLLYKKINSLKNNMHFLLNNNLFFGVDKIPNLSKIFNKFLINFNKLQKINEEIVSENIQKYPSFFEINYLNLSIVIHKVPSSLLSFYILREFPLKDLNIIKQDLLYFARLKGHI